MPNPPIIPESVRNLLGYRWREGDNTFERVFRSNPDRQPTNYHIRTGQMVETDADTLSHAEGVLVLGGYGPSLLDRQNCDGARTIVL